MSSGLEVPTLTIFDHRPRYPLVQEFFEAHDAIGCMHHVIRRVEALEFPNIVEFDPTAPRFHFGADRLVGVGSFPSLWIVWSTAADDICAYHKWCRTACEDDAPVLFGCRLHATVRHP